MAFFMAREAYNAAGQAVARSTKIRTVGVTLARPA
jgi:hypothetical protein